MNLTDFLSRKTQKKIAGLPDYLKTITFDRLNTPSASNFQFDLRNDRDIQRFEQQLRLYELNLRFVKTQVERIDAEVDAELRAVNQAKEALSQHKKLSRP